jgi:outer membrane translocation and assembly module TamA
VGLRWLTPIGRMAIDIGMNLTPDQILGEPRFGPYFSIDPL